jgi:hypothetical protein
MCLSAIQDANAAFNQLLIDIKQQANQWVVYSDLDDINDISYNLASLCNAGDINMISQEQEKQTTTRACQKLFKTLGMVMEQQNVMSFSSNNPLGLNLGQKVLKMGKDLGGCNIKLVHALENDASTRALGQVVEVNDEINDEEWDSVWQSNEPIYDDEAETEYIGGGSYSANEEESLSSDDEEASDGCACTTCALNEKEVLASTANNGHLGCKTCACATCATCATCALNEKEVLSSTANNAHMGCKTCACATCALDEKEVLASTNNNAHMGCKTCATCATCALNEKEVLSSTDNSAHLGCKTCACATCALNEKEVLSSTDNNAHLGCKTCAACATCALDEKRVLEVTNSDQLECKTCALNEKRVLDIDINDELSDEEWDSVWQSGETLYDHESETEHIGGGSYSASEEGHIGEESLGEDDNEDTTDGCCDDSDDNDDWDTLIQYQRKDEYVLASANQPNNLINLIWE